MDNKMRGLLVEKAQSAKDMSYSPYSDFRVGAALLSKSGNIYLGANIENSSYGAALCAERTAFSRAVMAGEREFSAIAIVGAPSGEEPRRICSPCGICRQVMAEHCSKDFEIILYDGEKLEVYTLGELLPLGFRL